MARTVPAQSLAVAGAIRRDPRLDVFRGLALVMIYINHVPGTVFEHFTSRNFGFSDAAEAFVVMSGIAAGLAYSAPTPPGRPWLNGRRAWARSWTLYTTHIVTTMMAIAVAAVAARWFGAPRMIEINNVRQFFDDQIGVMIGIPTLLHQIGYFNILPLYAVLVALVPGMVWLGQRQPWLLLALSVAVWLIAGEARLNFPAYPNRGGWFLNPLSWQLIFVIGVLIGIAMRAGQRLVPVRPALLYAALGYLALALVWVLVKPVGDVGRSILRSAFDSGLGFYLVKFDKTFLSLPRLLHVLALLYVISSLPAIREMVEARWARPLALMGRHGLPVFATGSVLCIVGQSIKEAVPGAFLLDAWIIGGGLLIQLMLAVALSRLAPAKPTAEVKAVVG